MALTGAIWQGTAHIARILNVPVILVLDAKGMSRSIHALLRGFLAFDPTITIAGVIINRIGSPRHRSMIEQSGSVPVLGWIPRKDEIMTKSRTWVLSWRMKPNLLLRLEPSWKNRVISMNWCRLEQNSRRSLLLPGANLPLPPRARIGIALDEAFCFYYQDNFDSLRQQGADLVFFSPIRDALPEIDGLYLGGGYPELHLPALESAVCTRGLKKASDNGLPVYGECGGLMYLSREILTERTYRMAGVLPAVSEMTGRVQALGYVKGKVIGSRSFVSGNQKILGHEFHYSRVVPDSDVQYAFSLSRGKGIANGQDGLIAHNALGSYTHSYFSPAFAKDFIGAAAKFSRE